MKIRRIKRKCPSCRQIMVRKRKTYICPDCGTRIVGDVQIRSRLRDNWTRIWK